MPDSLEDTLLTINVGDCHRFSGRQPKAGVREERAKSRRVRRTDETDIRMAESKRKNNETDIKRAERHQRVGGRQTKNSRKRICKRKLWQPCKDAGATLDKI
jgi:hypothetical protein